MLLSAVSVLVVAQSSSEIPEGLMSNPVEGQSRGAERNADRTAAAIGSGAVILPIGQTLRQLRQQRAGNSNALPSTPWS